MDFRDSQRKDDDILPMRQNIPSSLHPGSHSAKRVRAKPPSRNTLKMDEVDDISEWLGPWWERRSELAPIFIDTLTNFRPIQIRNFLKADKALALHRYVKSIARQMKYPQGYFSLAIQF